MPQPLPLAEWFSNLGLSHLLNSSDLLSGAAVCAALNKVVNGSTVRLNTSNTASARINNWNTLTHELQKANITVSLQDRQRILAGQDRSVFPILQQLRDLHQKAREQVQVDVAHLDARGDPKSAKSLLELLILVIVKQLGFSVKEAVALLSNDSKYLAHVLAKGFKEDPRPVEALLSDLLRLLPQLITLCSNPQNETFLIKSIKPGLISKFLTVSEISLQLLTQFTKNLPNKYEITKTELLPTLLLCLRRHPIQLPNIVSSLTQILGFDRKLLSLFMQQANFPETTILALELLSQALSEDQSSGFFQQIRLQQFLSTCIDKLRESEYFVVAGDLLIQVANADYSFFSQLGDNIGRMAEELSTLNLSKRSNTLCHSSLVVAWLELLGRRKNSAAPQFFRLAVERYKSAIHEEESQYYLFNFLQILDLFPAIPASSLIEAVISRFEAGTTTLGQLELSILDIGIGAVEEQLALRVFNGVTRLFIEEAGWVVSISDVLGGILRRFSSVLVGELTLKFSKVCLAVYYANLRKLNYSKSLIQGTVKLDKSNAFYRAKNSQIEQFLASLIQIADPRLNKPLQPLVTYSLLQCEMKNKEEAEGMRRLLQLLGDETELRKLYEQDARMLLEDSRNQHRKKPEDKSKDKERQKDKIRVGSDTLLLKKRELQATLGARVPSDAQKGLEKYTRSYLERVARLSVQEESKKVDEERKQELRRKFTLKILEKGIRITPENQVGSLFEFGSKEREQIRDMAIDFSHLPFYDPALEEDRDVRAVDFLLKRYGKVLKLYYHNYGGRLRPNTIKLFEDLSERAGLMQSSNVWRLLREHGLDQFITVKQVQFLVQKINAHLHKDCKDSSVLDYQVFENFLLQASLVMFSRPPKDLRSRPLSYMFQQLMDSFKLHAAEQKIDEKIFDEQDSSQSNQSQEIKELNEKLIQSPDYILPEGFKKTVIRKVQFDHKFYLQALDQSQKDVYEILDEILAEKLGFHIIEPYSSTVTTATARPLLQPLKERSLSSVFPRESRINKTGDGQSKEGEELNGSGNGLNSSKLENKFLKEKKLKEEEKKLKQQEEQKRREQRDKELKNLLEKHRQKQAELEREKQEQRRTEAARTEEERKKRQKYEEILKKKVQGFMEKKREDQAKEEEAQRKRKEEEHKNMQLLKQDVERKKKMVEQSKLKKKQEQQAKQEKQKAEKKKLEQEQKAKMVEQKERTRQMLEEFKEKRKKDKQERGQSNPPKQPTIAKQDSYRPSATKLKVETETTPPE